MSKINAISLVVILGAVIGIASFVRLHHAEKSPDVFVDPKDLDFGTAWEQHDFRWKLPVKNVSKKTIDIADVKTSCGCAAVAPASFVLAPGEVKTVVVALDLQARRSQAGPPAEWPFSSEFAMLSRSDSAVVASLTVEGRVRPIFNGLPNRIDFDESCVRGFPFPARTVRVATCVAAKRISVEASPPAACADLRCSRKSADSFDISFAPSATLRPGGFQFRLSMHVLTDKDEALPPAALKVAGTVVEDVRAAPSSIVFGAAPVKERAEVRFCLESRNHVPFSVLKVGVNDPNLRIISEPASGDADQRYRAVLCASSSGTYASQASFQLRQGSATPYEVTVPILYQAFSPGAVVRCGATDK